MEIEQAILKAAQAIVEADTLLMTAGAGIGVDSGLPDFRSHEGFWKIHPSYAKQKLTFSDLANAAWFNTNPGRAWGFYGYRYNLYRQTVPHAGFEILKQWQAKKPLPGFVLTSNVDGQFQKAGFAQDRIYECHGSIHYLQCVSNCRERIWPTGDMTIDVDVSNYTAVGELPRCPDCGGLARPNILMFDDGSWISARSDLQRDAYNRWKSQVADDRMVIIEIGAGYSVGRIRAIGQNLPGRLIRINPYDTQVTGDGIAIALPALAALGRIDQVIESWV
jgi:NAD-dependent SIR2 family protein deacetylase